MNLRFALGFAFVVSLPAACAFEARPAEERRTPIETCAGGIRNNEFDVDCSAACNHVMACKASDYDSDTAELTCNDCLGSCVAGVELGGNDFDESTEENKRSWQCAAMVEGCDALDHNCDIF